jgi:nicotinic acid phosphoribosyltransferase
VPVSQDQWSGALSLTFLKPNSHRGLAQPANVILLIDTYDTEAAATKVVKLAPRLAAKKIAITGVRLDSGDLTTLPVRSVATWMREG